MAWKVTPATRANPVVTAVFEGHLSSEEGAASAAAFRACFQGSPIEVVWDVTTMSGFDGGARSAWAETVWPLRGQITRLRIVGARGIIRIGATFLAVLLGKPYEFVAARPEEQRDRASGSGR
jgi:hypothetical protein